MLVDTALEAIIRFRIGQAAEAFEEAEMLHAQGKHQGMVNRAYYAMFHMTQALLACRNISTSKHTGNLEMFDREFIRSGLLPRRLSVSLHNIFKARMDAEYRVFHRIASSEAAFMLEEVRFFLEEFRANDPIRPFLRANRLSPRRALGRTGFMATRLGIGDLADRQLPAEELAATLHRAMDFGLNVIDTAPGYEAGYSEEVVGQALRGRRETMFVITKLDEPAQPAEPQLRASLARLQLGCVDGYVIHGLSTLPGWEAARAPGGLCAQMDAVKAAGLCRWVGISSHHPDVLRAALESGWCELVMFPIGAGVDARYVENTLPLARQLNVGTVCFKTFGAGKLLGDTPGYNQPLDVEKLRARPRGKFSSGGATDASSGPVLPRLRVEECLHYTLTCDPDVALLGLSFPNEQDAALAALESFRQPLSAARMAELRAEAARALEEKGPCWWNPPATE